VLKSLAFASLNHFCLKLVNNKQRSHETDNKEGSRAATEDTAGLPLACERGAGGDAGGRDTPDDKRGMDAAHIAAQSYGAADREGVGPAVVGFRCVYRFEMVAGTPPNRKHEGKTLAAAAGITNRWQEILTCGRTYWNGKGKADRADARRKETVRTPIKPMLLLSVLH
jgi:hypothetical protein